jgi:hypothetical protein
MYIPLAAISAQLWIYPATNEIQWFHELKKLDLHLMHVSGQDLKSSCQGVVTWSG